MPGGRTHDILTVLLAVPAASAVLLYTGDAVNTAAAGISFIIGGVMFGPDLDTPSRQTERWSVFQLMWLPYRTFFRHRSRWTHGMILGTAMRVVYFAGVLTAGAYLAALVMTAFGVESGLGLSLFGRAWARVGELISSSVGMANLAWTFFGLWLGAAAHTLTDVAGTYVKTGRITRIF